MRKFDRANGIVVATIVLCFMLTLGVCWFLAGEGIIGTVFLKEDGSRSFYALCSGGYDSLQLARTSAGLIKLRGGAGYVSSEEGEIVVVLSVYPDRTSAESVMSKISEKGLYIKELSADAIQMDGLSKDEKEAATIALGYFDMAFNTLYDLGNSLASSKLSVEDVKTQIKVLGIKIEDIKSEFYQKVQGSEKPSITEIKLALVTALALLDNVELADSTQALSSVRYQTVQLTYCYCALCRSV